MPDTLNQNSTANYAILLDFLWGASNAHMAFYTSWDSPITANGNTYSAAPQGRVKVVAGKQTGTVRDEPWTVTLPPLTPLSQLARPYTFAPVTCNIWEMDPVAGSTPVLMWSGTISKTLLNPSDAPGCIKAEVSGFRAFIQYPMGVERKSGCAWTLGDPFTCKANISAKQQTATISSVTNRTISAPVTIPGGMPTSYWTAGKVDYDGLAIGIIDGSAGGSALKLIRPPPPEWVGASAVFTPGCDKTVFTCDAVWANLARFYGLAIQSPSFNPLIGVR
jgi:hypothetical protein